MADRESSDHSEAEQGVHSDRESDAKPDSLTDRLARPDSTEKQSNHDEALRSPGDRIQISGRSWNFGDEVADVFPDHVKRSVPMYERGHELIARFASFFLTDGSVVYDLGCSTGDLLLQLARQFDDPGIRFVGIDREEAMINVARENCRGDDRISFQQSDILTAELEAADMIVSYYTMQFNRPRIRQDIFNKVYDSLNWGGAFFLFEKVRAPDARFQEMITQLYSEFKLEMGYSGDEILAKSSSLKGVMEPFSSQANLDLMARAGFVDSVTILKYLCFEGFLSIK